MLFVLRTKYGIYTGNQIYPGGRIITVVKNSLHIPLSRNSATNFKSQVSKELTRRSQEYSEADINEIEANFDTCITEKLKNVMRSIQSEPFLCGYELEEATEDIEKQLNTDKTAMASQYTLCILPCSHVTYRQ